MIASSTTLMQACKRGAPRAVNLAGVAANCIILFHLPVSPFFRFSPLSLRPGVVGVSSKCQGVMFACAAALCDLGDPGWGDPWFPHGALLLLSPTNMAQGHVSLV